MPIGLALIDVRDDIVPISLALIVYKLVSVLTLIADEIVPQASVRVDIDCTVKLSYTWIDTRVRKPYGVGHLLHFCITA